MKIIPISPTTLGTFQTCPRQFQAKYITKEVEFKATAATLEGSRVHTAIENRLKNKTPLPVEYKQYEIYAEMVERSGGQLLIEESVAYDQHGAKTTWKSRWAGGKADLIILKDDLAIVIDWKTGKVKDDLLQLKILTQAVYANYPQVTKVKAALIFLKDGEQIKYNSRRETFSLLDLMPLITQYTLAQTDNKYLPKPNGLCRSWCDVVRCEHNGGEK